MSTTAQKDEGTSLDTQAEQCARFCTQHGYTVLHTIQEDVSGGTLRRTGLDSVRTMAREGLIDTVVCYAPDRLSRALVDLLTVKRELEVAGVSLEFVTMPPDVSPVATAMLQMSGIFAELEKSFIMERTRRGKDRAAQNGRIVNWMTPYGYRRNRKAQTFEIHEEEAEVVRLIFAFMASGEHTLYSIAMLMRRLGYTTVRGGAWWVSTIQRILQNETYTGTYYWNMTRLVNGKQVARPKSEWVSVPVPPIITPDLFAIARANLWQNKAYSRGNAKRDYLLSGFMKCGRCGVNYRSKASRSLSANRYYVCPRENSAYDRALMRCDNLRFRAEDAEHAVWQAIVGYMAGKVDIPDTTIAALSNKHSASTGQVELGNQERALIALSKESDNLLEAYRRDVIDIDTLASQMAIVKANREKAIGERDRLLSAIQTQPQPLSTADLQTVQSIRDMIPTAELTHQEKRDVMRLLCVQIAIDGPVWTITLKPYTHILTVRVEPIQARHA